MGVVVAYLGVSVVVIIATESLVPAAAAALAGAQAGEVYAAAFDNIQSALVQVSVFAVFALWWSAIDRRSFLHSVRRTLPGATRDVCSRVGGAVLGGFALQFVIVIILSLLVLVAPALMESYSEGMAESGTADLSLLALFVLGVGAPAMEEVMCRGLMLEFSLRAVCPAWARARRAQRADGGACEPVPPISFGRFMAANALQAVVFGMLHGHVVQVAYAVVIGMVLGVVVWRTGRLRHCMLIHMAINVSSYVVDPVFSVLEDVAPVVAVAAPFVILYVAVRLFWEGTRPVSALPAGVSEGDAPRGDMPLGAR